MIKNLVGILCASFNKTKAVVERMSIRYNDNSWMKLEVEFVTWQNVFCFL